MRWRIPSHLRGFPIGMNDHCARFIRSSYPYSPIPTWVNHDLISHVLTHRTAFGLPRPAW